MSVFFAGMILGFVVGVVVALHAAYLYREKWALTAYEQGYSDGQADAPSIDDIHAFEAEAYEKGKREAEPDERGTP